MIRNDMNDISDDDFENVVSPCNDMIMKFIKETILDEFVAFDLATYYKNNAMWDEPFELQIKSAIEDLAQLTVKDCNKENIKDILKNKYKLNVVNESPIDIEEIKD